MIEKNSDGLYEVIVDDKSYSFDKWGAEEAFTTLITLAKMIGKPVGMLFGAMVDGTSINADKQIDQDMISLAFEALTTNLDEHKSLSIFKKLTSERVLCDGAKISFNTHYQDRLHVGAKVARANLEVQYGNFFDALRGLPGMAAAAPVQKSKGLKNRT